MKVFIAENDVLIAEHLAQIVETFNFETGGIAHNKEDAITSIARSQPDIALLDVKLEEMYDGIEVGEYIMQNHNFPVVYVTAHSETQTIEKALKTKPSGYILKPFSEADLYTAIQIAVEKFGRQTEGNFIFVKGHSKTQKLFYNEILYLKSSNNHVKLHTQTETFDLRKSLQEMLDDLDSEVFIRVHRSYAINKNNITQFAKRNLHIGDIKIPVSRKYIPDVKKLFKT